jgi:hypothetical protein
LHKSAGDLDYRDLFRTAIRLGLPPAELRELVRRMVFNVEGEIFSNLREVAFVFLTLRVVFLRMISQWSGGVGGEAGGIPDPSQPRMDANERE